MAAGPDASETFGPKDLGLTQVAISLADCRLILDQFRRQPAFNVVGDPFQSRGIAIFKWGAGMIWGAGRHGLNVVGRALLPGNSHGIPGHAPSVIAPV